MATTISSENGVTITRFGLPKGVLAYRVTWEGESMFSRHQFLICRTQTQAEQAARLVRTSNELLKRMQANKQT